MKFLLDANISPRVIPALIASGHQAALANDGATDQGILIRARSLGAVVVTCDQDFGQMIHRDGRPSAGLVTLSLGVNSAANQALALGRALADGRIEPGCSLSLDDRDLGKMEEGQPDRP